MPTGKLRNYTAKEDEITAREDCKSDIFFTANHTLAGFG
jgi:hypothetical protein